MASSWDVADAKVYIGKTQQFFASVKIITKILSLFNFFVVRNANILWKPMKLVSGI